jgi:hypothetical protein
MELDELLDEPLELELELELELLELLDEDLLLLFFFFLSPFLSPPPLDDGLFPPAAPSPDFGAVFIRLSPPPSSSES